MFTRSTARASQEPVDVRSLGGVAAKQAVLAQEPEIARLGDGLVWRCGHVIGIGQGFRFST